MIDFQEALRVIVAEARSFGKERVGVDKSPGRVLAERVTADRDYPPFNRSGMDGYAVRYADWEKGVRDFSVREIIYAGSENKLSIGQGECYKVMTGAAVPQEADAVFRKEDVEERGGTIFTGLSACRPFQHIARQGEDLRLHDTAIRNHTLCDPSVIGLLASLGKQEIEVERRPKITLFTTGNEVVPVGSPVSPVQIRNSNRWMLEALCLPWGEGPLVFSHLEDDRKILLDAIRQALESDLLIMCGGVSAGDADFVPVMLEEAGVKRLFHKVAIKPGKPFYFGLLPGGRPVFALPGNPFSCMVTFRVFILPYLHACFGLPAPARFLLPLMASRKKKTAFDEFFPSFIQGEPPGLLPLSLNGSGDIRLGLRANALGWHPSGKEDLAEGEKILCFPY